MDFFRNTNFRPVGGAGPWNFFHTADIGLGLLAHITNRVGDPPKNFKSEHLKLGLKFYTWAPITWVVVGVTLRNFTRGGGWGPGEQVDTNFTRGAPYKIWEDKNVQNSARFLTTFEFDREYLRNGSTYRKSEKYLINYI